MSYLMLIVIGIISVVVPAFLMFIQFLGVRRYNAKLRNTCVYSTACAGSERPNTPKEVGIVKLEKEKLKDSNGRPLNLDEYKCLVACGQSMLLGGIDDKDLLLVKPIDNLTQLMQTSFPSVLIIKRDKFSMDSALWLNDNAEKKVRRSWALCDLSKDDVEKIMKECTTHVDFRELLANNNEKFPSLDELTEDFKRRLNQYYANYPNCRKEGDDNCMVVISTTLDTQKQKVHFSIHPARMVEGEVCYSFHISTKQVA